MTIEELVQVWFRRVWVDEDSNAIDELYAPQEPAKGLSSAPTVGVAQFKAFQQAFLSLVDISGVEVTRQITNGDWSAAMFVMTATGRKSKKPAVLTGQFFVRCQDDQIVEAYNQLDYMSLFAQLELMPEDALVRCLSGGSLMGG